MTVSLSAINLEGVFFFVISAADANIKLHFNNVSFSERSLNEVFLYMLHPNAKVGIKQRTLLKGERIKKAFDSSLEEKKSETGQWCWSLCLVRKGLTDWF